MPTLTLREAAKHVGRHPDTLKRWVKEGKLGVVKGVGKGGATLVELDAVLAAASAGGAPPHAPSPVSPPGAGGRGEVQALRAHLADVQRERDGLARRLEAREAELAAVRVELQDTRRRLEAVERELAGGVRGLLTAARRRLGLT